jgi:hypothetical protein
MNASDRRARRMCELALAKLEAEPARVRAAAAAMIATWERAQSCDPWYPARWRELLAGEPATLRRALLAATDEGQMLRANNPFAGLFTRAERSTILAAGREP